MDVSMTNVIIGVALGFLLAGIIFWLRNRPRDAYAVVFVLGIAALAVAVTMIRVDEYREHKAVSGSSAAPDAPVTPAGLPAGGPPPKPLAAVPPPPLMKGPTGGAAPAAVENPYAGGAR